MSGRLLFSPVYCAPEAPVKAGVIDEEQRDDCRPKIHGLFKRSRVGGGVN